MGSIYFIIVVFLLCLAVFDLFVGVSNDAVNFLQSAVGARVAKFRTVLIIASVGVLRHQLRSAKKFMADDILPGEAMESDEEAK